MSGCAVQGLALNAPALGRKLSFLDNVAMVIVGARPPPLPSLPAPSLQRYNALLPHLDWHAQHGIK